MTRDETATARGDWMQTYTGRAFYPADPRPEDIDPADIAHALSLTCRYGGHVKQMYSVAEHCVLMSYAVPAHATAWALLHDATEAYIGDVIRPLKTFMPEYRAMENRLMRVICERFGLPFACPASVTEADNRILLDERAALMGEPPQPWAVEHLEPLGVDIRGWMPDEAEWRYRTRLRELLG